MRVLVAVGSRHDRICSIGAFARAEARAFEEVFEKVEVLEPDAQGRYPDTSKVAKPDAIIFHAPSLHDRKKPWNAVLNALKLRYAFPRARFVPIVHEFSEAPAHWKIRQAVVLKLSHGAVVNSNADESEVRRWASKLLRWPLGPTLFIPELLAEDSAARSGELLAKMRAASRNSLGIDSEEKWLVHPGLLTAGKGINFLSKLEPVLKDGAKLVLMGGIGPKDRDREFAQEAIASLRALLGDRLIFIDSPDDEKFKQVLLAADLVVLPYDNGLSERRSSFLSAMCCGANIWTTLGPYSAALRIEKTGVHGIEDVAKAIESVNLALNEVPQSQLERRLKNLAWAKHRSWNARARQIRAFLGSLQ